MKTIEHALWRIVPVAVLTLGLLGTPAGVAVGVAVAVGTAISASAFSAQTCTPTTAVVGNTVRYKICGYGAGLLLPPGEGQDEGKK